jgi:hypothetical protein
MCHKIRITAVILFIWMCIPVLAQETRGLEAPVRPNMARLTAPLRALLSRSSSPMEWEDPRNRAEVEKDLKTLLGGAHDFKGIVTSKGEDPAIAILQPYLTREASITLSAYQVGQYEYSRMNLRNVVSTCIGCHSRDPDFRIPSGPENESPLKKPSALENARFFSAVRNFDRSIEEYHKALFQPGLAKSNLYTWERAFREAMAVLIRVKRNPEEAGQLVKKLRSANSVPYFLKRELEEWQKDLGVWLKEKAEKQGNENTSYAKIQRVFRTAIQKKRYPMDHSADALFLRLSSLLYEYQRRYPHSKHLPEIWYLLGVSHLTLDLPPFENLHEQYLEACIRSKPHSTLALTCYSNLEQSVYFGFTGSSGTRIPDEVKSKLLELWGLSFIPNPMKR